MPRIERSLRLQPPDLTEAAIARAIRRLGPVPPAAAPIADAIESICLRGGKRIRPRLCVLGYEGVSGRPASEGVHTFAAGIELLHVFMLVHDDLIDRSEVRRGGPAVHAMLQRTAPAHQANDLAMLSGDLLFALAIETICSAKLPAVASRRAMSAVIASARDAAVGECLDVIYSDAPIDSLSSADLAEVLRLKSARYTFEAPLVAGAILADADETVRTALGEFGSRVGIAFQLADDLLDLFGDERASGKPTGGDIRQRKRTVLASLALERANSADSAELERILSSGTPDDEAVKWVTELVARTGVATEVARRVTSLVHGAIRALPRAKMQGPAERALRELANSVVTSIGSTGVTSR